MSTQPEARAVFCTRTFTALGLVADLDCRMARPGYSLARGGPAPTSGAAHETYDDTLVLPTRVRVQSAGNLTMRFRLGIDKATGAEIYHDDTLGVLAGEVLDCQPYVIVDATTTADFTLCWPR